MHEVIRLFILLLVLASAALAGTEKAAMRRAEIFELIAKSILDADVRVVLAETRFDAAFMETPRPVRQYAAVVATLDLTRLFLIENIRGGISAERILAQVDVTDVWERRKLFYHLPRLSAEGVWLCFLRPVDRLPQKMGGDGSELSDKIKSLKNDENLLKVADVLGFSSWLNKDTWFVPAFNFSIFKISRPLRDIAPSSEMAPFDVEQVKSYVSRTRKASSIRERDQFQFTEVELEEIIRLTKLFGNPDKVSPVTQSAPPRVTSKCTTFWA